ncbi:MAG: hypothetical protein ACT4QD_15565 [Acidobacteriota bacterium]
MSNEAIDPFAAVADALKAAAVRYVVIGVWGANYYAESAAVVFNTHDRDLFLPPDPDNLVECWSVCERAALTLMAEREPLDRPRDSWLAARVIERRALTRALGTDLHLDLSLVMAGFDFEAVWAERRSFIVDGVEVPVARLHHIIQSKHAAGRDKDRLFLATHREALEALLRKEQRRR